MRTILLVFSLFLALNTQAQTTGPAIEFTSQVVDYGEIEEEATVFASLNLSILGINPLLFQKFIPLVDAPFLKNQKRPLHLVKKEKFK